MRNVLTSVISGLFHIKAYSGKNGLDKDIIKSQEIIMKEQKARHKMEGKNFGEFVSSEENDHE